MININHLLKVSAAWISVTYIICYVGVWIYPPVRTLFMRYALHGELIVSSGYFGIGNFIAGLIIWNIVTLIGVWIFAYLFNSIKK